MRIDKTVGTKKNNKLDSPKEDKSFKKLSFLPNVTPIEKIKRKVHVREMISFPFFVRFGIRKRPARTPSPIIIKTSMDNPPLLRNFYT